MWFNLKETEKWLWPEGGQQAVQDGKKKITATPEFCCS